MNKALFTRKAVNIDELKRRTGDDRYKNYFVIEKVVELPVELFSEVCDNLLCVYDFIKDLTDLAYVDSNGVWHCVLIKTKDGVDSIILNFEGYQYCRYSSYIPDCTALLEELEIIGGE